MDYNMAKHAYCYTETDAWAAGMGCGYQSLSYDELLALVDGNTSVESISVVDGDYIKMHGELGRDFYIKQFRLYTSESGSTVSFNFKDSNDTWHYDRNISHNGSYYYYNTPPSGVYSVSPVNEFTFILCASGTVSVYEAQVLNWDDPVDFGNDGTDDNPQQLPAAYSHASSIAIYNDNPVQAHADARVLPSFTGTYNIDQIIRLSMDDYQDITNSGGWYTIDTGYRIPEDYGWELGEFDGTEQISSAIRLESTETIGTWTSPVIKVTDPSCISVYVYGTNKSSAARINKSWTSVSELLEVRASNTEPQDDVLFTMWAKEVVLGQETLSKLGLGKSIYQIFESDGTQVVGEECDGVGDGPTLGFSLGFTGYKDSYGWASGDFGWQHDIGISDEGIVSFFNGAHYCGHRYQIDEFAIDYRQVANKAHFLYTASRDDTVKWDNPDDVGSSYVRPIGDSPPYTDYIPNLYGHTMIPIPNTYRGWYIYINETKDFGFPGRQKYRVWKIMNGIKVWDLESDWNTGSMGAEQIHPQQSAACLASDCNGIWIARNIEDKKYVHKYDSSGLQIANFPYTDINVGICKSGLSNVRGFWGFRDNRVTFYYQSEYSYGTLTKTVNVTAGPNGDFSGIQFGQTDSYNNFWCVDRISERVIRINYETGEVDHDQYIGGVMAVVPHPDDGTAYVACNNDPLRSGGHTIRRVEATKTDNEFQCDIPGWQPTGVKTYYFLTGHITDSANLGYYRPVGADPVWGSGGSLSWRDYPNANLGLPQGTYKQLRLTLRRDSLGTTSPYATKIRIPTPLLVEAIPWRDYKNIYIDTNLETGAPAGHYNMNVLVWWPQE